MAVLGMGGTIAGAAASKTNNAGYVAAQLSVESLLQTVALPHNWTLVSEQVAQIDSKSMDYELWRSLALRCEHWLAQDDIGGVVITHGTDTLEETAYFLHRVLPCHSKPVVLTCAMRPATSLSPDGPQNLNDALVVASTSGARGVVVVCGGAVHGAMDVLKQHTSHVDAFSSGDAGPVGYVENNGLRLLREWPAPPSGAAIAFGRWASTKHWPRVEIVLNHTGNEGEVVRACSGWRWWHRRCRHRKRHPAPQVGASPSLRCRWRRQGGLRVSLSLRACSGAPRRHAAGVQRAFCGEGPHRPHARVVARLMLLADGIASLPTDFPGRTASSHRCCECLT